MAIDVERLLAEAVTQHGIRLDRNDPAVVLVTLNRLVLEEAAKSIMEEIRRATREFEGAASRVQTRLGAAVAAKLKPGNGATISPESWPRRVFWALGLGSGASLFLTGIAVGKWVLR